MSFNYNPKSSYVDVNECTSRGACSISPSISALSELGMKFLEFVSYYVLKLEKLGAQNDKMKLEIINTLASFVSINEFSEEQLFSLVEQAYFMFKETQNTYKDYCKRNGIVYKELSDKIPFSDKTPLAKAISIGEKLVLKSSSSKNQELKNLISILDIVIKSVSINIIKLTDFNEFDTEAADKVLSALNLFNRRQISTEKISGEITSLADLDKSLQLKISDNLLSSFGGISEVKVSHSTRGGKAILVSGNNFFDLLKILRETKNQEIDIYTHSNLLITHALKVFQEFDNLRGHYGDLTESCILDFATFPGAILLTKNSKNNTEYLYRGRLYSNDFIVPKGVIKIEDNNYNDLIEAAKSAKGFSKGKTKPDTIVGYDEADLFEKIENIFERLNDNELSRLFILGTEAHRFIQKEYFDEFFEALADDEFVISFSYSSDKDHVLTIPIGNYIPLGTGILNSIFKNFSLQDDRLHFMFSTCDVMTVSSIINLASSGARNIYMAKCSPTLVNPSVFETFRQQYSIKVLDKAVSDLSKIRNEKSTQ
ncbi:MAG: hypothetical protein NC191_00645 [Muribaculaceae bacterium]|nr:hypothetical protein [Muribaculaceae bacterium]